MTTAQPHTVAVIVAHPDDEVLAFGGSMARHAAKGERVCPLILATGLASRSDDNSVDGQALQNLRAAAEKAADILGAQAPEFADFPDNRMDGVDLLDVVKRVEAFRQAINPDVVFTHHPGDLNVDHRVTFQAVLTAFRPLPGEKPVRLYTGEVLSSSEYGQASERFQPNTYVDIEKTLSAKQQALRAYADELRDWPHPRSVEAVDHLARLRGSECGLEAAEALHLIRAVFS